MSIITRGYTDVTIITRGYGESVTIPVVPRVVEAIRRGVRRGRAAYDKQVKPIFVAARLMRINEEAVEKNIQGQDEVVPYKSNITIYANFLSSSVSKVIKEIVIKAALMIKPVRDKLYGDD
jgi:hypothetical protein